MYKTDKERKCRCRLNRENKRLSFIMQITRKFLSSLISEFENHLLDSLFS